MCASKGPDCFISVPGYTLLRTRQASDDSLAGLHVSLARVPGPSPRVTLDANANNSHRLFRTTKEEGELSDMF
jgi:hypothetical protein